MLHVRGVGGIDCAEEMPGGRRGEFAVRRAGVPRSIINEVA